MDGHLQNRGTVAGVAFPNGIREGDVHTVLSYVIREFNHRVEPVTSPGCWGWFVKEIEGSDQISNHASGTAVDINAPRHPLGARGTFTAVQRDAIRAILRYCDGVVRWGGDYTGRADEMHWEIVGNRTRTKALAAKITRDEEDVDDATIKAIGAEAARQTWGTGWGKGAGRFTAGDVQSSLRGVGALVKAYAAQDHVDQIALGQSVAATLAPLVIAALPHITEEQMEAAVKHVLLHGAAPVV